MCAYPAEYLAVIQRRIAIARRRNFRRYLKQGTANAQGQVSDFLKRLQTSLKKMHEAKVDLACARAEELITDHLKRNPTAIVTMAQRVLSRIAEHTEVEIAANPGDAAEIRKAAVEIGHHGTSIRKIAVSEDEALLSGSMIVKANKSIIDAQIKTQLRAARTLLLNGLDVKNG